MDDAISLSTPVVLGMFPTTDGWQTVLESIKL